MNAGVVEKPLREQLLELRVALAACILTPMPAMIFWRSQDGRCVALWVFCAGCFSLVAYSFRRPISSEQAARAWANTMRAIGAALSLAWVAFSLLWIVLVDRHDFVALFVGFQILIPSFCIAPYLTLITRKPLAAVIFSAFLLGCMKGIAGVVVNLVYGWGNGHHEIPWTAPNLMLTTFWAASAILCISCYVLGAAKFQFQHDQLA